MLFALRRNASANKKAPFERHFGRSPNTITSLLTNPETRVLASDPKIQLTTDDIESGHDSTILARERTRGTKLGAALAKQHERILKQTQHTISFLPAGTSSPKVISKRDLLHRPACCAARLPGREEEHARATSQEGTHSPDRPGPSSSRNIFVSPTPFRPPPAEKPD